MIDAASEEIGEGLILHRRVIPSTLDFEVLDQINVYQVENQLDHSVEILIDISGSEGAQFESSYQVHKKAQLRPKETKEVGRVKLFGDWTLKIKFTYTIKGYGPGSAAPKDMLRKTKGLQGTLEAELEQS